MTALNIFSPIEIKSIDDICPGLGAINDYSNGLISEDEAVVSNSQEKIRSIFEKVMEFISTEIETLANLEEDSHHELMTQQGKKVRHSEKLQKIDVILVNLKSELAGMRTKILSFNQRIGEINSEIIHIDQDVDRKKIERIDGLTDLIPGVGAVGAVLTDRPFRSIPFYSPIKALISAITQNVEKTQKRKKRLTRELNQLTDELSQINLSIKNEQRKRLKTTARIYILKKKEKATNQQLKQTASKLTDLREFHSQMVMLHSEFSFLRNKVDRKEIFKRDDFAKKQIPQFKKRITTIQDKIETLTH